MYQLERIYLYPWRPYPAAYVRFTGHFYSSLNPESTLLNLKLPYSASGSTYKTLSDQCIKFEMIFQPKTGLSEAPRLVGYRGTQSSTTAHQCRSVSTTAGELRRLDDHWRWHRHSKCTSLYYLVPSDSVGAAFHHQWPCLKLGGVNSESPKMALTPALIKDSRAVRPTNRTIRQLEFLFCYIGQKEVTTQRL